MAKKSKNNNTTPRKKPKAAPQVKFRQKLEAEGYYGNQVTLPYEKKKDLLQRFLKTQLDNRNNYSHDYMTARRFFLLEGFSLRTVRRWIKKDPSLADFYLDGKEILGDKREVGMLLEGLPPVAIMYNLHNYLDDWKKADDYHDNRKIKVQGEIRKAAVQAENADLKAKMVYHGMLSKALVKGKDDKETQEIE